MRSSLPKPGCVACLSRWRLPAVTRERWKTPFAFTPTRSLSRERPPRYALMIPLLIETKRECEYRAHRARSAQRRQKEIAPQELAGKWLLRLKIDQDVDDVILRIRAQPVSHLRIMYGNVAKNRDRRLFQFCQHGIQIGLIENLAGRQPPVVTQRAL